MSRIRLCVDVVEMERYQRLLVFTKQQLPGGTKLIKQSTRKIFLVLDNLKVHHSYIVRNWLEKHKEQIEVFFLPSYSPELNPDEYLNCEVLYIVTLQGVNFIPL